MNAITYHYRGPVERGTGEPGYRWHEGFSENTPEGHETAPWMTYRECQKDAKARGARAVFADRDRTWVKPPTEEKAGVAL